MKNQILGIVALGVLGSCNSESKNEAGRFAAMPPVSSDLTFSSILDTKTGIVYTFRRKFQEDGKGRTYEFEQINALKSEVKTAKIYKNPVFNKKVFE
jgi:hypothetical protein